MDAIALLEKIGAPLATGLTGFVGAALNFKRRIDDLEKDFKAHKGAVKEEFDLLKKAWKLEMDDNQEEFLEKVKELTTQLATLRERFESYQRGSISDFADASEMHAFMEAQRQEWATVQRTLGQIEGWMERNPPAPPSPYQAPRSLPTRTKR